MEAFHAAQVAFMFNDAVQVVRCHLDELGSSQAARQIHAEASDQSSTER